MMAVMDAGIGGASSMAIGPAAGDVGQSDQVVQVAVMQVLAAVDGRRIQRAIRSVISSTVSRHEA